MVNPTTGALYFTHTDRLGTVQKLTDASQNTAWSATYNPFGDTHAFTGTLATQSLRLPGQQFDAETGYNHNGFRDYAGAMTRYIQSDPIGLAAGTNTYQYVRGNPFKYTDRMGLDPGSSCSLSDFCYTGGQGSSGGNNQYGSSSGPLVIGSPLPVGGSGPGTNPPLANPSQQFYFAGGGGPGQETLYTSDGNTISAIGFEGDEDGLNVAVYSGLETGPSGATPIYFGSVGAGPDIHNVLGWNVGWGQFVTNSDHGWFFYGEGDFMGTHRIFGGGTSSRNNNAKLVP